MNNQNQWDQIIKLIVPLTFLAIWALTSLFNRESKSFPARSASGPQPTPGPLRAEPTTRWASPSTGAVVNPRRVTGTEDDVLIISNDPSRTGRPGQARSVTANGTRRSIRGRTPAAPPTSPEPLPSSSQARMSGVSQSVNQHLATNIGMTPLSTISPMTTTSGTDLASSPSAPSKTTTPLPTISTLIPLMKDPIRLREAFLVNELLKPPLSLRRGRGPSR